MTFKVGGREMECKSVALVETELVPTRNELYPVYATVYVPTKDWQALLEVVMDFAVQAASNPEEVLVRVNVDGMLSAEIPANRSYPTISASRVDLFTL